MTFHTRDTLARIAPKLGKREPRHDPRTFQLARYLAAGTTLPPPPATVDWSSKVATWPMFLNDQIGDCTCAAAGHMVQAWTANGHPPIVTVTDKDVLTTYERVTGYDPKDPSTDQGAVELDVLKFWRTHGLGNGRHKIGAFTAVAPTNHVLVRDAVFLFGGAYLGLALPASAQGQDVWDVPPGGAKGRGAPGSWGGHAVNVVDYDDRFLTVVTWGALLKMTWAFLDLYCDEAYALLSNDFLTRGHAPNGFDLAALKADLAAL